MSTDDRRDVFARLHVSPRKAAAPHRSYSLTVLHLSPPKPAPAAAASVRISLEGDLNDPHTLLRAVFQHYATSRASPRRMEPATMDGVGFARFCRACPGLVGRNFGSVDIDLTFAKVKPRGDRRVPYALFVEAIGLVALKKHPDKTLETAMRTLLDVHIATLPNLDARPLKVSTTQAPLVSRALSDAAAQADKVRASLHQLQRQVQALELEAQKPSPPDDPHAITDRIKFADMLHDELQGLLDAVPKSVSARVGLVKAVDAAASELEGAVRAVAKAQVAWLAKRPPSPPQRRQSVPASALATYISTRVKVLEKRTSPSKAAIARVHLQVDRVAEDDDDDAWNPFASIFPGLDGNE
ncbi:hypothetical protein SDRG_01293 [Saprolegnia diclina VS20]|uniref:Uncharacterized protein n=1 Tax=Saprolegnia diclina (strain VS20) TaxID=1156394 RepID=T0QT12_SAPDV|nr:hypothetical protein SDRG_01293 [Saprolegnia diclina VS20]EQC41319.1 hypothetical protein SDRG_01293 [Saprolegnia diclina VS20]|eukprot:XP_008605033.1 hypothetical protein SDRG_01293 [Saprolegnia diclina VS20]